MDLNLLGTTAKQINEYMIVFFLHDCVSVIRHFAYIYRQIALGGNHGYPSSPLSHLLGRSFHASPIRRPFENAVQCNQINGRRGGEEELQDERLLQDRLCCS